MQAHADPPDVDALLDAVEAGNMDRVRELLDGGDVGVNDSDEQALNVSVCKSVASSSTARLGALRLQYPF